MVREGNLGDAEAHASRKAKHIPELDGVRGIAILLVLIYHFGANISAPTKLLYYAQQGFLFGWAGVDLFFVLSGFLITGILLDAREQPRYFSNFYIRRVLRIFPLYYLYLVLLLFLGVTGAAGWASVRLEELPWYAVYLQNFRQAFGRDFFLGDHLWSLAIEEQFYMLWPFCIYLLGTRTLKRLCFAMCGAALLGRLVVDHYGISSQGWDLFYKFTPFRLEAIALGSLVAIQRRQVPDFASLKRIGQLTLAGGLVPFLTLFYFTRTVAPRSRPMETVGYTMIDLAFAGCLILACVAAESGGNSLLRFPLFRSFGKYSYGMYMWHLPILGTTSWWMMIIMKGGPPFIHAVVQILVGSALTYGLALLSWYTFEKRFMNLRLRWADGRIASGVLHTL